VHTWPLRNELRLDVYSCRDFDSAFVESWAKDMLGVTRFESVSWER